MKILAVKIKILALTILVSFCSLGQELPTVDYTQVYSTTQSNLSFTLDAGDNFGRSIEDIGDIDGNGYNDIAVGAPGDDDAGTDFGAVYILFMGVNNSIIDTTKIVPPASFTMNSGSNFGIDVTNMGDLDGNGVNDIVVGSNEDTLGSTADYGSVSLFYLGSDGSPINQHQIKKGLNGFVGTHNLQFTEFGSSVENIGDLNGDGHTDLAVGMWQSAAGGTNKGGIYILFLDNNQQVIDEKFIAQGHSGMGIGLSNHGFFGASMSRVGDLNGDGVVDLAVGARGFDSPGPVGANTGALVVLILNSDGTVQSYQIHNSITYRDTRILTQGEGFGVSMDQLGDINGDGNVELLIGSFDYNPYGSVANRGAFYIASLDATGDIAQMRKYGTGQGGMIHALAAGTNARYVTRYADSDGDGLDEVLLGAIGLNGEGGFLHLKYDFLNEQPLGLTRWYQKITPYSGIASGGTGPGNLGNENFGRSCSPIGDFNQDGFTDYVVGANHDNTGGSDRGAVHIVYGNVNGATLSSVEINSSTTNFTGYLDNFDIFGTSVADMGDLSGNGYHDIAVGAPFDDDGFTNAGAFYILFLNALAQVDSVQKISATSGGFTGTLGNTDLFGQSIDVLGDLNGDGIADLIVGAKKDDDGGTDHGAAYILFLNADGTVQSHQKISSTSGGFSGSLGTDACFGVEVAGIGDLNQDGVPDAAVTIVNDNSSSSNDNGGVFILFLNASGTVASHSFIGLSDIADLQSGSRFGISVDMVPDMNGDGYQDLVLGAHLDDDGNYDTETESNTGAVWLLCPDNTGSLVEYQKISPLKGRFYGEVKAGDFFGVSVSYAGDIDSDGHPELLVGSMGNDESANNAGALFTMSLTSLPMQSSVSGEPFVELKPELDDGSLVYLINNKLYFVFDEDYTSGSLTFNVYDEERDPYITQANQPLISSYGDNRFVLDFDPAMDCLRTEVNILEVINDKGEKWYLRFKQTGTICP